VLKVSQPSDRATEHAYKGVFYRNLRACLTTLSGHEYTINVSLDESKTKFNPEQQFFQASRWQVLFACATVAKLEPYYNGRMLMHLKPPAHRDVVIFKPRVTELKGWLGTL
jgi:hypothetical protein